MNHIGKIAKPGTPRPDSLQYPVLLTFCKNLYYRSSLQYPVSGIFAKPGTGKFAKPDTMYITVGPRGTGFCNFPIIPFQKEK